MDFFQRCRTTQMMVLKALALGMPGVPDDFFVPFHTLADNQLRLLHCGSDVPAAILMPDPSAPREDFDQGEKGRINAHTDFSTGTMLFQDDCGGLEVEDNVSIQLIRRVSLTFSIGPECSCLHHQSREQSSSTLATFSCGGPTTS